MGVPKEAMTMTCKFKPMLLRSLWRRNFLSLPALLLLLNCTLVSPAKAAPATQYSLLLRWVDVVTSIFPQTNTGLIRIVGIINDNDTYNDLPTELVNNNVSLDVIDGGGTFNVTVALTDCQLRSARGDVICISSDHMLVGVFTRLPFTPGIYIMSLQRLGLSQAQTGSSQPTGGITVTLHQGGLNRTHAFVDTRCVGARGIRYVCVLP
jgi:hypothetical protein